jgi:hypothetical protein
MRFLAILLFTATLGLTTPGTAQPFNLHAHAGDPHVLNIHRWPLLPPPFHQVWGIASYFTTHGDFETDASVTISGQHVETQDAWGYWPVRRPLPNYMLGIWADVPIAVVIRAAAVPGSIALTVRDPVTGQENARIDGDGTIRAKAVVSEEGIDDVLHIGRYRLIIRGGLIVGKEEFAR